MLEACCKRCPSDMLASFWSFAGELIKLRLDLVATAGFEWFRRFRRLMRVAGQPLYVDMLMYNLLQQLNVGSVIV